MLVLVGTLSRVVAAPPGPASLPPPDREIPLFDGKAPGSEQWNWTERTVVREDGHVVTQNVAQPTLQYFAPNPAKACGVAVIIAPGGAQANLMIVHEGRNVVRQLQAMGIASFILKYRLVHTTAQASPGIYTADKRSNGVVQTGAQQGQNIDELERADGREAVRWLRQHAADFGCDPHRIGIVGFSAGAVPAAGALFGPVATRPDFAALIYPYATFDQPVPVDAPPLFLASALDDVGATDRLLTLFQSWRAAQRPAELHLFQTGGHGFLQPGGGEHVIDRLGEWMRVNGWLPQSGSTTNGL